MPLLFLSTADTFLCTRSFYFLFPGMFVSFSTATATHLVSFVQFDLLLSWHHFFSFFFLPSSSVTLFFLSFFLIYFAACTVSSP